MELLDLSLSFCMIAYFMLCVLGVMPSLSQIVYGYMKYHAAQKLPMQPMIIACLSEVTKSRSRAVTLN